jgi:hypothetical protein
MTRMALTYGNQLDSSFWGRVLHGDYLTGSPYAYSTNEIIKPSANPSC